MFFVACTQSTWVGEASYYEPNATHGPKGIPVRFQMSFDARKWAIDDNGLDHRENGCEMYPKSNWGLWDTMDNIFGVDPYVSTDPWYYTQDKKTVGDLTFITPRWGSKHSRVYYGYCYDDEKLPICFVVVFSMYPWPEDGTEDCLADAEDVLSTLRVSTAITSTLTDP